MCLSPSCDGSESNFNDCVSLYLVAIHTKLLQNGAEKKRFWESACVNDKCTVFQATMLIPHGKNDWNSFVYI